MSNIPELDLDAASLAHLIDVVLDKETAIERKEEARRKVNDDGQTKDAANSSHGAFQQVHESQRVVNNEAREPGNTGDDGVQRLREDLASVTARREQLLEALEAANRKAAIGELSAELTELTDTIEKQLVRYAALTHLINGTPLDLLDIASLYSRESKKHARRMVADIEQSWRQV